jgi:hypothetical protein
MYGFGDATYFILLDAFFGYYQICLSPSSIAKTAFFAPRGRKYVWVVMPFGLRNCQGVFLGMNMNSSDPAKLLSLQLLQTLTASRPFSQLVADIIKSDDKLFFISYSPPNQTRCEWRLVQIDFPSTMKLHPSCLQDGKFLVQFYIQHFIDSSVNLTDQRFWLEYHSTSNSKTLGSQYHLIPPTSLSPKVTKARNLVPY